MKLATVFKYITVFNKRYLVARMRGRTPEIAAALGCDGQTKEIELECLARHALVPPDQAIVEVGSFRGRSCVALALAAREGVTVISLDPYLATVDWRQNVRSYSSRDRELCQLNFLLSGASRKVQNLHLTSAEGARGWGGRQPIGLIFIDGSHLYEDVKVDFESWFPAVPPGGVVAFHDSTNKEWGVYPLMEQLKTRNDLEFLEVVDSISVFRKVERR